MSRSIGLNLIYRSDNRSDVLDGDIAAAKRICGLAHDLKSTDNGINGLALSDCCALVEGRGGSRTGEVAGKQYIVIWCTLSKWSRTAVHRNCSHYG